MQRVRDPNPEKCARLQRCRNWGSDRSGSQLFTAVGRPLAAIHGPTPALTHASGILYAVYDARALQSPRGASMGGTERTGTTVVATMLRRSQRALSGAPDGAMHM